MPWGRSFPRLDHNQGILTVGYLHVISKSWKRQLDYLGSDWSGDARLSDGGGICKFTAPTFPGPFWRKASSEQNRFYPFGPSLQCADYQSKKCIAVATLPCFSTCRLNPLTCGLGAERSVQSFPKCEFAFQTPKYVALMASENIVMEGAHHWFDGSSPVSSTLIGLTNLSRVL